MATFTPPTLDEVPSHGEAGAHGPMVRLMRYYKPRPRGVTVYKMTGGLYAIARFVPGLDPTWTLFREPTLPIPEDQQVNDTQATSWMYGRILEDFPQIPNVEAVYYGGTSYQVSDAEAFLLDQAGFGAYLTDWSGSGTYTSGPARRRLLRLQIADGAAG
jgi:hypothetical protein